MTFASLPSSALSIGRVAEVIVVLAVPGLLLMSSATLWADFNLSSGSGSDVGRFPSMPGVLRSAVGTTYVNGV